MTEFKEGDEVKVKSLRNTYGYTGKIVEINNEICAIVFKDLNTKYTFYPDQLEKIEPVPQGLKKLGYMTTYSENGLHDPKAISNSYLYRDRDKDKLLHETQNIQYQEILYEIYGVEIK